MDNSQQLNVVDDYRWSHLMTMKNNKSELEKVTLEHQAAKLFMTLYEAQYAIPMRHIWHNQPAKPDVSCYRNGHKLDLEIAHLYGSETEAMAVLGRSLSLEMEQAIAQMAESDSAIRLKNALGRLLNNKANKRYDSQQVWLVIRNASSCWTQDDLQSALSDIPIAEQHPFKEIWLIADFYGNNGLIKIF